MADEVQQFVQMLRTCTGELLDDWLAQLNRSNLLELQSVASGVKKDKEVVGATSLGGSTMVWLKDM